MLYSSIEDATHGCTLLFEHAASKYQNLQPSADYRPSCRRLQTPGLVPHNRAVLSSDQVPLTAYTCRSIAVCEFCIFAHAPGTSRDSACDAICILKPKAK